MKREGQTIAEKIREFEEANLRAAQYYLTLPAEEYPALHDFARRVFARQPKPLERKPPSGERQPMAIGDPQGGSEKSNWGE